MRAWPCLKTNLEPWTYVTISWSAVHMVFELKCQLEMNKYIIQYIMNHKNVILNAAIQDMLLKQTQSESSIINLAVKSGHFPTRPDFLFFKWEATNLAFPLCSQRLHKTYYTRIHVLFISSTCCQWAVGAASSLTSTPSCQSWSQSWPWQSWAEAFSTEVEGWTSMLGIQSLLSSCRLNPPFLIELNIRVKVY